MTNENEDDQRCASEGEILEEVDGLTLLCLWIRDSPEVMHHEGGEKEEDCEEERAKICINAKCNIEATEDDHDSGDDDRQLRSWNFLELCVSAHCLDLSEVREAGTDEEEREKNARDDEEGAHFFLSNKYNR